MAKRTILRRTRKNKSIRKVMRGCNRRRHSRAKVGGAGVEVHQYAGASPQTNQNLAGGTASLLAAQEAGKNVPPPVIVADRQSNIAGGNITSTSKPAVEPFGVGGKITSSPASIGGGGYQRGGGARTRHHKRRLRYKKSMARKSRHA